MGSGQTPSPENGEREAPAAPASQAVIETTPRQRWIALAILLAATFMNLIDVTIVNVALPTMQEAFSASTSEIEWVVAVYVLALAMGLMPFGRMGDIVGRRNMFVLGVAVFTIASAMCGFSGSMTMLIVSRIVQGLGAAMMTPQTIAITQVIFPPRERAAAFSLFGLATGLAAVTGPVLGGTLIGLDIWGLDWRPIFLVNLPVGAIAIAAALWFIPSRKSGGELRNDFVGILLGVSTVLAIIFPLVEGRELGWPAWTFAMMAGAVPLLAAFLYWERRRERLGLSQMLPWSLITDRNFLVGVSCAVLLSSGIPGFFMSFALYLQAGHGLTPLESGITTLPFSFGVMFSSQVARKLGMRWIRKRIALGGLSIAIAMFWLQLMVSGTMDHPDRIGFIAPLFLGGVGLGVTFASLFPTVLSSVQSRDAGSGSGALQSFQQLGGAFGVAVIGQLFFARLATELSAGTALPQAYSHAVLQAFKYNIAAFAAVAVLVFFLPRPSPVPSHGHAGTAH